MSEVKSGGLRARVGQGLHAARRGAEIGQAAALAGAIAERTRSVGPMLELGGLAITGQFDQIPPWIAAHPQEAAGIAATVCIPVAEYIVTRITPGVIRDLIRPSRNKPIEAARGRLTQISGSGESDAPIGSGSPAARVLFGEGAYTGQSATGDANSRKRLIREMKPEHVRKRPK